MMTQRVMKRVKKKRTQAEAAIMVGTVKKSNYYITEILTRVSTGNYLQKKKKTKQNDLQQEPMFY